LSAMRAIRQVVLCAFLVVPPVVVCFGCGSGQDERASVEHLRFDVVDSLLGPAYEIKTAGKRLNLPLGFAPVPDSVLAALKTQLTSSIGPQGGIEMVGCFLDTLHAAGMLVSVVDGYTLSSDTVGFFGRYRQSLCGAYGGDQVREGEYWVKQIYVKNFLITDSVNVRFQLLCLSAESDAVELIYFAPRDLYPKVIKRFESSIGSLQLINREGVE